MTPVLMNEACKKTHREGGVKMEAGERVMRGEQSFATPNMLFEDIGYVQLVIFKKQKTQKKNPYMKC